MIPLIALKSFKNFFIDRGLRKRFREDFDRELPQVHEIVDDSGKSSAISAMSDGSLEFDKTIL
jgi:hypothetical protein